MTYVSRIAAAHDACMGSMGAGGQHHTPHRCIHRRHSQHPLWPGAERLGAPGRCCAAGRGVHAPSPAPPPLRAAPGAHSHTGAAPCAARSRTRANSAESCAPPHPAATAAQADVRVRVRWGIARASSGAHSRCARCRVIAALRSRHAPPPPATPHLQLWHAQYECVEAGCGCQEHAQAVADAGPGLPPQAGARIRVLIIDRLSRHMKRRSVPPTLACSCQREAELISKSFM